MASSHSQIIDHIVLFKVKENTEPSEVNSMISRINGLRSLDQVLHISAGPLLRIRSPSLTFNYILHSRYNTKEDLDAYTVHPNHVSVTKENARIVEDIMAVDWIVDDLRGGPVQVPPGSALRVAILRLKESLSDEAKSEISEAVIDKFQVETTTTQFTSGLNFSPGRAKGFSIVFLAIFKNQSDLEAADSKQEWLTFEDKFQDYLEALLLLDYVVHPPQPC